MRNLAAVSLQFESKPGDKQANLATIRRFVESATRHLVAEIETSHRVHVVMLPTGIA
jgi:predicted amidohydrolase